MRRVTCTTMHRCYRITHPSYRAVTLKGYHPHGTHIDVHGACDISHVCMRMRASERESSRLCGLVIPLPSFFFVSCYHCVHVSFSLARPRCDSMFPISETIGILGDKKRMREETSLSCHTGLGICLFSTSVRQRWWEEKCSLPDVIAEPAWAAWALTGTVKQKHQQHTWSSQKDSLWGVTILILY